jgi:hypothetical protein
MRSHGIFHGIMLMSCPCVHCAVMHGSSELHGLNFAWHMQEELFERRKQVIAQARTMSHQPQGTSPPKTHSGLLRSGSGRTASGRPTSGGTHYGEGCNSHVVVERPSVPQRPWVHYAVMAACLTRLAPSCTAGPFMHSRMAHGITANSCHVTP